LSSPPLRRSAVDWSFAIAVLAFGVSLPPGAEWRDPAWGGAVVVSAGAMLLRRRAPLIALAVVLLIQALVHAPHARDDPFFQFLVTCFASYSVGAYRRLPHAIGALIVTTAFFVTFNLLRGGSVEEALVGPVWFVVAFVLGVAARHRSRRESALHLRTDRLQAEAEERAAAAVAAERANIARDLHDAVGHSVSAMALQVGAVRRRLTPEQRHERDALLRAERAARDAVTQLRDVVTFLRSPAAEVAVTPRPSLDRVDELVEAVKNAGVPASLRFEGVPAELPPGVEVSAYRIVQEALTNILKHAGDAQASVCIRYERDALVVEVVNDGRAVARPESAPLGHGLIGMRERASFYNGVLEAGPRSGGGFAVVARLPLKHSGIGRV